MANDPAQAAAREARVFCDDLVGFRGRLGIISRTYHEEGAEDEFNDENGNPLPPLQPGQVRVQWVGNDLVDTADEKDLSVIDRVFPYSEIVTYLDPALAAQHGTGEVVGVHVAADVLPLTEVQQHCLGDVAAFSAILADPARAIPNAQRVDCRQLTRLQAYDVGAVVTHGEWIGVIMSTRVSYIVYFFDGAVCEVEDEDGSLRANDLLEAFLATPQLFPGMIVDAPPQVWQGFRWIRGQHSPQRRVGVILETIVRALEIDWRICRAASGEGATRPETYMSPDDVTLMDFMNFSSKLVGDVVVTVRNADGTPNGYTVTSDGVARGNLPAILPASRQAGNVLRRQWLQEGPPQPENFDLGHVQIVVRTVETTDVMWKDGTVTYGIPATQLKPAYAVDDFEFWPRMAVTRTKRSLGLATTDAPSPATTGIVLQSDAKERVCKVQFFEENGSVMVPKGEPEEVPVYELAVHPDWHHHPADIVLRLTNDAVVMPSEAQLDEVQQLFRRFGPFDVPLFNPTPTAGFGVVFYMLPTLQVVVVWPDQTWSLVSPPGLTLVDSEDLRAGDEDEDDYGDHMVDDDDGEMYSEYSEYSDEDGDGDDDDNDNDDEDNMSTDSDNSSHHHRRRRHHHPSATGRRSPTSPRWVPANGEEDEDGGGDDDDEWESVDDEDGDETMEEAVEDPFDHVDTETSAPPPEHKPEAAANGAVSAPAAAAAPGTTPGGAIAGPGGPTAESQPAARVFNAATAGIERFAILETLPADHRYATGQAADPGNSARRRRIMNEHRTLESSLPDGIFVRSFESDMDKMRVLIVGASGTPYEDVLFEFDIALPPDYPTTPPQVYFYSMTDGLGRLNPNLYEDGRVCLSLLNTWMGDSVEVWTPKSTVLQLLVSLQSLVLVKYPYYNEAGFERHRGTSEGFANALAYNERAFLLSMRTAITMIRNPPGGFEDVVRSYYLEHGVLDRLRDRCRRILNDAPLTDEAAAAAPADREVVFGPFSKGARAMVAALLKAMDELPGASAPSHQQ